MQPAVLEVTRAPVTLPVSGGGGGERGRRHGAANVARRGERRASLEASRPLANRSAGPPATWAISVSGCGHLNGERACAKRSMDKAPALRIRARTPVRFGAMVDTVTVTATVSEAIEEAVGPHSEQYRPLAGYGALIGAFNGLAAGGLLAAHRAGRLPDRLDPGDLALAAVATYKLSRVIAKDRVTSALRAPFTTFQDDSGFSEVDEAARGTGLRRAVGELLVCPECLDQWVATGFVGGLLGAPRVTRTVAAVFAVYAAADVLQIGHAVGKAAAKRRT